MRGAPRPAISCHVTPPARLTLARACATVEPMTDPTMPGAFLELPNPPDLPAALGYPGCARYVVFFSDDGDHITCADGRTTRTGNAHVFNLYCRLRAVEPLLRPFDLAESVLVIDQARCRASI